MSRTAKLLIYLTLSLFVVSGAKAYEVEEDTGIICDTQAQVERYVRLGQSPQAITIINHEANACAMVNIRFIRGGEVSRIYADDKAMQVVEIIIVEVNMSGWTAVKPLIQYSLFNIEERKV